MASPIAHSITGLALGMAAFLPRSESLLSGLRNALSIWKTLLACVFLACAPDIDYIPGLINGNFNMFHQQASHSAVWMILLAAVAWLIAREHHPSAGLRLMAILLTLTLSHLLIDLLTNDNSIPLGIMVAWPFSDRYVFLPFHLFPNMVKQDWTEILNSRNFMVAGLEFLITTPILCAVFAWKTWTFKKQPTVREKTA